MKRLGIIFSIFFLLLSAGAQAKVYWVGRNIDISPEKLNDKKMLTILGHSYLILIPDEPEQIKDIYPTYAMFEKQLGCDKRGVVIGAYPSRGTEWLGDLDGYLEAQINAERENIPTAHFFCGTDDQKKKWGFVSGEVKTNLSDAQFIKNLLEKTLNYIFVTQKSPVDYHAVRSLLDGASVSNELAQNCNSFAFSLLAFSGASHAPDIGAQRKLPGNRHLLPQHLFYRLPIIQKADHLPEVVKNDDAYRMRVNAMRELRSALSDYRDPIIF